MTHVCVDKLSIIGSDNGLSPGRRPAIIWTNAGILLIGPLGTNFSEILIEIYTFSFKKMRLKGSSAKWRPFCLGLNVLTKIVHTHLPCCQRIDHIFMSPPYEMLYACVCMCCCCFCCCLLCFYVVVSSWSSNLNFLRFLIRISVWISIKFIFWSTASNMDFI